MSFKILEHTADVRLKVEGNDLKELFSGALAGLMAVLKPQAGEKKISRNFQLKAKDSTALLIDFLNEVLFSAGAHKEMYDEAIFKKLEQNFLEAELKGREVSGFGEDVKAVTYHEADIRKNEKSEWQTNLVFDI